MLNLRGSQERREQGPSVGQWLARSRIVRVITVAQAVALLGVALYANALYRAALEDHCDTLPAVDMSMDELIAFRQRVSAYQQDPSPAANLSMSGREIGVLFGEGDALQMRVELVGDRALVNLTVPAERGCWNVRFYGQVGVDAGVARVVPDELQVGGAELSWLVRGVSFTIEPDSMPEERLERLLDNTRSLVVEEGVAHIRLANRWDVW